MQGITDRDVAYDILLCTKQTAEGFCQAALESASPSCYRTFMELHDRAQETHRRIWEYLHRRQEYRVSEAHPQEVQAIRERMERLRDDHLRSEYMRGETARERNWEERRREFEPVGAGRAGSSGFRGTEWNSGPGVGAAPNGGGGYNTAGVAGGYNTAAGVASPWERPAERRFEPSHRY